MSTSTDLKDVLRRRSVTSKAELTVEATTACMAIRAVARNPELHLGAGSFTAVVSILNRINQLAVYRETGQLKDLVDNNLVATDTAEPVQIMARAARDEDIATQDPEDAKFPRLDSLIGLSQAIQVELDTGRLRLVDSTAAEHLAAALAELGEDVLSDAVDEDRKRTPNYAFL